MCGSITGRARGTIKSALSADGKGLVTRVRQPALGPVPCPPRHRVSAAAGPVARRSETRRQRRGAEDALTRGGLAGCVGTRWDSGDSGSIA